MYMTVIKGWVNTYGFSADKESAKGLAVREKRKLCKGDVKRPQKWTWATCEEFYGANIFKIEEGTTIID